MRLLALAAVAALSFALAGPARAQDASPTPSPLLDQRGVIVTRDQAFSHVGFNPVIPVAEPLEYALLAPFHNDPKVSSDKNAGVGFEYIEKSHTFVLREWPRAGGSLSSFADSPFNAAPECKEAYLMGGTPSDIAGIVWATNRMVFALQQDDARPPRDRGQALRGEFIRLARRGACRN
jgi:hypothetical protein